MIKHGVAQFIAYAAVWNYEVAALDDVIVVSLDVAARNSARWEFWRELVVEGA